MLEELKNCAFRQVKECELTAQAQNHRRVTRQWTLGRSNMAESVLCQKVNRSQRLTFFPVARNNIGDHFEF